MKLLVFISHELTEDGISDTARTGHPVDNSGGNIRLVIANRAYNGEPVYRAIRGLRQTKPSPKIVIPSNQPSVPDRRQPHGGIEGERHAAEGTPHGRIAWQRRHEYGKRSLVETAISRIKRVNDGRLTSRTFGAQQNEVAIQIKIAN